MTEPQATPDRPNESVAEASDIDLGRYLGIVRKHMWVILATLAVGITAAVLWTMRQPVIYQAQASVIVNPRAPQVYGNQVQEVVQLGTGSYWSNQEYYNTQIDIIESYDFAQAAVIHHELYDNPALVKNASSLSEEERIETASQIVAGAINASHDEESRIVRIQVRHRDPELATDLANYLVDTYIQSNISLRSRGTGQAIRILSTGLDVAETQLRDAANDLYAFKKESGLLSVSLEDRLSLIAAKLERYTTALSDARIKRIELAALRDQAKDAMAVPVLESPIFALTGNTAAETLKAQYFEARQSFLELRQKFGPKHPAYVAQKKKVDEAFAALEREAKLAMREIEDRYATSAAQERQFRAEVERLKQEAMELGPKQIAFADLERARENAENRYDLVVGRLRDSKLSSHNKLGNIQPHQRALAGHQVAPRMKVNIAVAAMLSLCLGLALAVGLEYLDRTVKTAEEVEAIAGAPLLGMIPAVATASDAGAENVKDRDLYIFQNPTSQAAECCRSIRTNILFSGAANKLRALTVTSPSPREGKTTSAIYLGTTMAQSGQRVLLVDTDMRRPRLHKALGVPRGHGLSSLLIGESSFDDAIKTTDIPNLFLLPCGPTPPNPAELLLTDNFSRIIEELRGRFDRILFDSPPLQAVSDAAVLARLSDGVVLVAHGGKTSRDELSRASRRLADVDAKIVGVILNNLDLTNRKYGNYYYYYAYGQNENEPAKTTAG